MKRRDFFGAAPAGALLAGMTGCGSGSGGNGDPSADDVITDIGGMPIDDVREQYRYDLFDDFLVFFDKHVIDHDLGGFMCNVNHDGSQNSDEKNTWYLGRGSWCWSYLYNNFGRDPHHLEVAEKAVALLMKHVPSGDDFWPSVLDRKGNVTRETGGLAGDCYIAEGLAEYAKATGEDKYMALAKDTMDKCWRHYERPDFQDGASPYPGARNLWYWMLFMWFGTNMLDYESDPSLEKRTALCVDAIMNHHNNPKFDLMNNVINHDLSISDDPKHSELAGCGHATEALWMIMYEAVRTKDRGLFNLAAKRFERHVAVSWDDVYGGVFNDCRNVDENIWQLVKIHWAQVFVLMGSLPVIEHTNAMWAHDWFGIQNEWIRRNFLLEPHGFHLWKATVDRKATFDPKSSRKDLYHHPRHLMLNLLALDRIIERGGMVSDVFN